MSLRRRNLPEHSKRKDPKAARVSDTNHRRNPRGRSSMNRKFKPTFLRLCTGIFLVLAIEYFRLRYLLPNLMEALYPVTWWMERNPRKFYLRIVLTGPNYRSFTLLRITQSKKKLKWTTHCLWTIIRKELWFLNSPRIQTATQSGDRDIVRLNRRVPNPDIQYRTLDFTFLRKKCFCLVQ